MSLSARLPPEGMSLEEAAAATAPPEGSETLEALQPWRYITDDKEAEGCNVIEMDVSGTNCGCTCVNGETAWDLGGRGEVVKCLDLPNAWRLEGETFFQACWFQTLYLTWSPIPSRNAGFGPLPPGLQAASDAAREGKAPGKLTVSLALALPGGGGSGGAAAVVISDGTVRSDGSGLSMGPHIRQLLSKEQVDNLRVSGWDGGVWGNGREEDPDIRPKP